MPSRTARKVQALRRDFKTGGRRRRFSSASAAHRSPAGSKEPASTRFNAERIDLLELIWANLLRLYEPEAARSWLFGLNPHLRGP